MTKKDYEMVVEWVNTFRRGVERHGNVTFRLTFDQFVERIADDLQGANKNFDREKFLKACDVVV